MLITGRAFPFCRPSCRHGPACALPAWRRVAVAWLPSAVALPAHEGRVAAPVADVLPVTTPQACMVLDAPSDALPVPGAAPDAAAHGAPVPPADWGLPVAAWAAHVVAHAAAHVVAVGSAAGQGAASGQVVRLDVLPVAVPSGAVGAAAAWPGVAVPVRDAVAPAPGAEARVPHAEVPVLYAEAREPHAEVPASDAVARPGLADAPVPAALPHGLSVAAAARPGRVPA